MLRTISQYRCTLIWLILLILHPPAGRDVYWHFSMRISAPLGTFHSPDQSPFILPMTLTADAALISSALEAGVDPKKIQKAFPCGQNPNSPACITLRLSSSRSAVTEIEKYISPPQRWARAFMGSIFTIDSAVGLSFNSAATWTCSAVILIICGISSPLYVLESILI